ncbi:hypothetical protein PN836_001375 [Ningiella sp. W23]|uniref:hypothetical protein n=1 Tax=Ningiella sp. W23 TaxID=3023715 RepID=UPI00375801BD
MLRKQLLNKSGLNALTDSLNDTMEPKSGDIVWQSRKLASRERTADISCVTIDDAQAIMLSTPSYLYLAK